MVLGPADGSRGLAAEIRRRHPEADVAVIPVGVENLAELERAIRETDPPTRPVLLLVAPDQGLAPTDDSPQLTAQATIQLLERATSTAKSLWNAHVIAFNVATAQPGVRISQVMPGEEPLSISAHRVDRLLIDLSHRTGISVVDVDRIVAEIGALQHTNRPFEHSDAACDAVTSELVDVMAEYGFFDDRPLLPQIGKVDS